MGISIFYHQKRFYWKSYLKFIKRFLKNRRAKSTIYDESLEIKYYKFYFFVIAYLGLRNNCKSYHLILINLESQTGYCN